MLQMSQLQRPFRPVSQRSTNGRSSVGVRHHGGLPHTRPFKGVEMMEEDWPVRDRRELTRNEADAWPRHRTSTFACEHDRLPYLHGDLTFEHCPYIRGPEEIRGKTGERGDLCPGSAGYRRGSSASRGPLKACGIN